MYFNNGEHYEYFNTEKGRINIHPNIRIKSYILHILV